MKEFLKYAEENFDRVIIDSPPLLGISDALILTRLVNNIVLVANALKTEKKLIELVKERLKGFNIKIMGAVLNCINTSAGTYYNYAYYNKYYSHYYKDKNEASKEADTDLILDKMER